LKRCSNESEYLECCHKGRPGVLEHTSLAGEFFFNRSVALKVDLYSVTALRDRLFELDEKKKSHALNRGSEDTDLSPTECALEEFEPENYGRVSKDALFVIGRNIYQAACGNAFAAVAFIKNFPQLARKLPNENGELCSMGCCSKSFSTRTEISGKS